jgi:hypothetical protein
LIYAILETANFYLFGALGKNIRISSSHYEVTYILNMKQL